MEWECNDCAETENGYGPCRLETPEWMGDEHPKMCVITDAECNWNGPVIRTEDAIQSEQSAQPQPSAGRVVGQHWLEVAAERVRAGEAEVRQDTAQQPRVSICQHAIAGKYMCLNDGLLCQGQCGASTEQAC